MLGAGYIYNLNSQAAIYLTSDGGLTWKTANTPSTLGAVTSIWMIDALTGYASVHSGTSSIWKTTDGGQNWNDISPNGFILGTSVCAHGNVIALTTWSDLSGVSLDGGATWTSGTFGDGAVVHSNMVTFADALHGVTVMGPQSFTKSGEYYTSDGGVAWNPTIQMQEAWSVYGDTSSREFFTANEGQSDSTCHSIMHSTDYGVTWNSRYEFTDKSIDLTGHIAGAVHRMYIQTVDGTSGLYRSDDNALSWIPVGGPNGGRDMRFCVTGCDGEVVYAFDTSGNVWKTGDGGDGTLGIPSVELVDTALTFAPLSICWTDSLQARIFNLGCEPLVVSVVSMSGDSDFSLEATPDTQVVASGNAGSIQILLQPLLKGVRSGTLHVRYWSIAAPHNARDTTLALSATIVNGTRLLVSSLQAADLGQLSMCASADTTITLHNRGCYTITISRDSLDNGSFTLIPDNVFPITLLKGESYSFRVLPKLDTTGHPSFAKDSLRFFSNADTSFAPIPLRYSIGYPMPLHIYLVPMTDTASADAKIYYTITCSENLAALGVDSLSFRLSFVNDLLTQYDEQSIDSLWEDSSLVNRTRYDRFIIRGNPDDGSSIQQDSVGGFAKLWFRTSLAPEKSTALVIDSCSVNPGDTNFVKCVAYLESVRNTTFTFIDECGNQVMRNGMDGDLTFRIASVQPDPVRSSLSISIDRAPAVTETLHLAITDALGRLIDSRDVPPSEDEKITMDGSRWPAGALYLRVSGTEGFVTRRFVKF